MEAGRNMLEAVLIYCKIDVKKKIAEFGKSQHKLISPDTQIVAELQIPKVEIKVSDIESELKHDKKLIEITTGKEDGGDGDDASDSGPSEDNLDEEELALIFP